MGQHRPFLVKIDRILCFFFFCSISTDYNNLYYNFEYFFLSIFGHKNHFFLVKIDQFLYLSNTERPQFRFWIFLYPVFSVFSLRFRLISGTWSWWHQCCTSIQYQKFSQQEIDRAGRQRVADVTYLSIEERMKNKRARINIIINIKCMANIAIPYHLKVNFSNPRPPIQLDFISLDTIIISSNDLNDLTRFHPVFIPKLAI